MIEKSTLPNYKWIKVPIDYLDDPDFMGMSDSTAGAFMKLYLLAGKADAGGLLCNGNKVFGLNDLTWRLRSEMTILKAAINEMLTAGILVQDGDGYRISHFIDEQGPGDDDERVKWRARQNKHRSRIRKEEESDKEVDKNRIESHGDVTVTPSPQQAKPPPDSLMKNPAIVKYRDIARTTPNDAQRLLIAEQVQNIELWGETISHFKGHGWNVRNVISELEMYNAGGPSSCSLCSGNGRRPTEQKGYEASKAAIARALEEREK